MRPPACRRCARRSCAGRRRRLGQARRRRAWARRPASEAQASAYPGLFPQAPGASRGHLGKADRITSADIHRASAIGDEQCEPGDDGNLHRRRAIEPIRESEKRLALIENRAMPNVAERGCWPAICRERDELHKARRHAAPCGPTSRAARRGPAVQRRSTDRRPRREQHRVGDAALRRADEPIGASSREEAEPVPPSCPGHSSPHTRIASLSDGEHAPRMLGQVRLDHGSAPALIPPDCHPHPLASRCGRGKNCDRAVR